jgi:hypothetical protein
MFLFKQIMTYRKAILKIFDWIFLMCLIDLAFMFSGYTNTFTEFFSNLTFFICLLVLFCLSFVGNFILQSSEQVEIIEVGEQD